MHHAYDYLAACYADPLTIASIAQVACLSPFHFQRLFKARFGATPMQALREQRLQRARALLADGATTVQDAALAVGYSSPASFTHLYRRRFGRVPSAECDRAVLNKRRATRLA